MACRPFQGGGSAASIAGKRTLCDRSMSQNVDILSADNEKIKIVNIYRLLCDSLTICLQKDHSVSPKT